MLIGSLIVLSDLAFVWATKLAIDIATKENTALPLPAAISLLIGIIILQAVAGNVRKVGARRSWRTGTEPYAAQCILQFAELPLA